MGVDIKTFTFDGDTPGTPQAVRSSGHIVVTNPDMLHQGILPHHTLWVKLFENLKYVVIDEMHNYRGVSAATWPTSSAGCAAAGSTAAILSSSLRPPSPTRASWRRPDREKVAAWTATGRRAARSHLLLTPRWSTGNWASAPR